MSRCIPKGANFGAHFFLFLYIYIYVFAACNTTGLWTISHPCYFLDSSLKQSSWISKHRFKYPLKCFECVSASWRFVFRYIGHLKSLSETYQFNEFLYPLWPVTDDSASVTAIFGCEKEQGGLQRTEISPHTLPFTLHQNSSWCTSNYTENNKWLWVIFSSGCWRTCMCDEKSQANLVMTNENYSKERWAVSVYKKWHCFYFLT